MAKVLQFIDPSLERTSLVAILGEGWTILPDYSSSNATAERFCHTA